LTCVPPLNQPPPRGSLVAMLIEDGETSSRISTLSSASLAASVVAALAVFCAMTSTVLPVDGVT
jgi:hypothetical protein